MEQFTKGDLIAEAKMITACDDHSVSVDENSLTHVTWKLAQMVELVYCHFIGQEVRNFLQN